MTVHCSAVCPWRSVRLTGPTTISEVTDAAFRAVAADQRVFDEVVALGLANGRLTPRTLAAAARHLH